MRTDKIVKLSDGSLFNASKPLEPFNKSEWVKGITFDLSSKRWGGKGWQPNAKGDGETRAKDRLVRVGKAKSVKVKAEIKPAIAALCDNEDQAGRTLESHRAMVEWYGERYDDGRSPVTGEVILDSEWLKGSAAPRNDKPLSKNRHSAFSDNAGIDLLAKAFKALHDDNETDD